MLWSMPKEKVSRRTRPAKAPLSREAIADAGLELLVKDGPDGLTLRRVAMALDTGAASLYVYLSDVEELRAVVLDRALRDLPLPTGLREDWRKSLTDTLRAYVDTLLATPGLGRLAMTTIPVGDHAMRLAEAILARLADGGIEGRQAAWGMDLLILHCAAIAAEQDVRRLQTAPLAGIESAIANAAADAYPHIARLREELTSGTGEARFAWAVNTMVDGLVAEGSR